MPPKTASNSIKECLLDSIIDFDEFPQYYTAPKIHLFLSELVGLYDIKDWREYKIIQVVRNPNTRFVSSYFHQLKIIPKDAEGVKIKKMSFSDFSNHFYNSLNSDNFLAEFYGNYKFIHRAIFGGKSWGGSRTWLNQIQWNDLGAKIKYIKLEDITDDITPLSDELGVYLPSLEKFNTNKSKTDYNSMIDNDTQAIINEVYHQDFSKLNY